MWWKHNLLKARLARIRIAKASSGAAFVNKKKAAEARLAAQESGLHLEEFYKEEDIFELQHHHLLRCLEKTTRAIKQLASSRMHRRHFRFSSAENSMGTPPGENPAVCFVEYCAPTLVRGWLREPRVGACRVYGVYSRIEPEYQRPTLVYGTAVTETVLL
ncbi:hypothetical protein DBV15_11836 [Temnothorax longispinosus]|uniref:Potassium channel voltage dependent Kv4 C-terminal domain-containing protein n=1 Tax=Temnothorax longispinosus TaxID=300112 RepID=A0A4S2KG02_9HYME|nr:hypothetical protein DBV15_11836 [Temnothorax longispinosus]